MGSFMKIEQIIQSQTSSQAAQIERIQPAANDMVRESKEMVFVFEQKASKVTRTWGLQKGWVPRAFQQPFQRSIRRRQAVAGSP